MPVVVLATPSTLPSQALQPSAAAPLRPTTLRKSLATPPLATSPATPAGRPLSARREPRPLPLRLGTAGRFVPPGVILGFPLMILPEGIFPAENVHRVGSRFHESLINLKPLLDHEG